MCHRLIVCLCLLAPAFSHAGDVPQEVVEKARVAYRTGDYDSAYRTLSHFPGLLGVVPLLDRPKQRGRAEIFFSLGRIHMASGDTARARLALVEAFRIYPQANRGIVNLDEDRALADTRAMIAGMRRKARQQALGKTTFWGAAGRSLLLPGWGQMYRGHKKRGYGFMGTSAALAAVWFVTDRSYRSAYETYRNTRLNDLSLDQRGADAGTDAFTQNFERAQSRAKRANLALGLLAVVWMSGVLDHLIIGPAQVSFSVPLP